MTLSEIEFRGEEIGSTKGKVGSAEERKRNTQTLIV
jgi:hypothetical protein